MNRFACMRLFIIAVLASVLMVPTPAQQVASTSAVDTDFQSWDELDLLTRVNSKLDVTWIARMRFSEEETNPAHAVLVKAVLGKALRCGRQQGDQNPQLVTRNAKRQCLERPQLVQGLFKPRTVSPSN